MVKTVRSDDLLNAALGAAMRACISAVFQQLKHENSSSSGEKECGQQRVTFTL